MRDVQPHAQDQAQRIAALGRVPREVFDLLANSSTPVKAYDLLWRLQEKRGRSVTPTTIYRALKILVDAGLAHRIEGANAYVLCTGSDAAHEPSFLVCERCGAAREVDIDRVRRRLAQQVATTGFQVVALTFTIRGVCEDCRMLG